jgi:hypothetical protein
MYVIKNFQKHISAYQNVLTYVYGRIGIIINRFITVVLSTFWITVYLIQVSNLNLHAINIATSPYSNRVNVLWTC